MFFPGWVNGLPSVSYFEFILNNLSHQMHQQMPQKFTCSRERSLLSSAQNIKSVYLTLISLFDITKKVQFPLN